MASWTQEDLDNLTNLIAQGAQSVQYEDRKLVCRSLADMLRLRDIMRRDLGLIGPNRRTVMVTNKGLDGGRTAFPKICP